MSKKPINILLIEDNPDHVELIVKELKNHKLMNRIYVTEDGQSALDFLFRSGKYKDPENAPRPGLILLDLKLPKVDGIEVLKRIKSDPDLKVIPVIVLTTSAREKDIDMSYKNGADSYIVKPVKFQKFSDVINKIKLYWILTNIGPEVEKD